MVPGIPAYGRSFTLNDPMYNGVSAKLNQKHPLGHAGNLTKTDGYLDYVETCRRASYMGWKREWVKYTATPYIYHKDQWVSYDDKDSTDVKVNWFRKHWMGGVFLWSLEADDHSGDCLGEVFPMVQAAWKPLKGYLPLSTTSRARNQLKRRRPEARFLMNIVEDLFKMFIEHIMSMFGGGGSGGNSASNGGGNGGANGAGNGGSNGGGH